MMYPWECCSQPLQQRLLASLPEGWMVAALLRKPVEAPPQGTAADNFQWTSLGWVAQGNPLHRDSEGR